MSNLYVSQTVNGDLQPVKVNGESSALEIAQDEIKVKTLEIDGTSKVPTPTSNEHIANKKYVDDNAGGSGIDGSGAASRIPVFSDVDTLTSAPKFLFDTSDNALILNGLTNPDISYSYFSLGGSILLSTINDSVSANVLGAFSNGSNSGIVIKGMGSVSGSDGQVMSNYRNTWEAADADITSLSGGAAVSQLAIATDVSEECLLIYGYVRIPTAYIDTDTTNPAGYGAPVYLSTTAGSMSCDPPTASGDVVRVVGYIVSNTTGTTGGDADDDTVIFFNPSGTWVEI